jgi:hypothetical protein
MHAAAAIAMHLQMHQLVWQRPVLLDSGEGLRLNPMLLVATVLGNLEAKMSPNQQRC